MSSDYYSVYLSERPVWKIFHHSYPSHSTSMEIHFPFYQIVLPIPLVLWLSRSIKHPRLSYSVLILESFTFYAEVPMLHCHCCQSTQKLYQCFTTRHSSKQGQPCYQNIQNLPHGVNLPSMLLLHGWSADSIVTHGHHYTRANLIQEGTAIIMEQRIYCILPLITRL